MPVSLEKNLSDESVIGKWVARVRGELQLGLYNSNETFYGSENRGE
jgi:hypothetical protein